MNLYQNLEHQTVSYMTHPGEGFENELSDELHEYFEIRTCYTQKNTGILFS